jgi:hypothetical protein
MTQETPVRQSNPRSFSPSLDSYLIYTPIEEHMLRPSSPSAASWQDSGFTHMSIRESLQLCFEAFNSDDKELYRGFKEQISALQQIDQRNDLTEEEKTVRRERAHFNIKSTITKLAFECTTGRYCTRPTIRGIEPRYYDMCVQSIQRCNGFEALTQTFLRNVLRIPDKRLSATRVMMAVEERLPERFGDITRCYILSNKWLADAVCSLSADVSEHYAWFICGAVILLYADHDEELRWFKTPYLMSPAGQLRMLLVIARARHVAKLVEQYYTLDLKDRLMAWYRTRATALRIWAREWHERHFGN